MKKYLYVICLFLLIPAFAINIVAQSMTDIGKDCKNSKFRAKVIKGASFKNNFSFIKNDIIEGTIIQYVEPKRAKRSAYVILRPDCVIRNNAKTSYNYKDIEAKVIIHKEKDVKEMGVKGGVSAGLTVGSRYAPGLSQAYYFTKGAVHPEKDKNRLTSGVKSVYDNSVLSYVEKGNDIHIKKDEKVDIKLYYKDVPKWRYFKRTK